MKPLSQYRSKLTSKEERIVVTAGEEQLIERNGLYLIKSVSPIGQARVASYRGIDPENDPESFKIAIENGD